MPKATKVDAGAPTWTKSSWGRVLELQPRLQELLSNSQDNVNHRLTSDLVNTLNSDNSGSAEARKHVNSWCRLAYTDVDPMPMSSRRLKAPTFHQKYSTFFDVHRELLKGAKSRADTRLQAGRHEVQLDKLVSANKTYKQCMIVPETVIKPVRELVESDSSPKAESNYSTHVVSLPQTNTDQSLPSQTGVLPDSHESGIAPGPAGETQREVETMALGLNLDGEEPGVSPSSSPLFMREGSVGSGPGKVVAPATTLLEINETSNQPSKCRRGVRGTESRKHWNNKKVAGAIQDDKSKTMTNPDGTPDVPAVIAHSPGVKKKKSTELSKKDKKQGQSSQVSGQSLRCAIKNSKLDPPQIGYPGSCKEHLVHGDNETLLDENRNAVQLDSGFTAFNELATQTESLPNLENIPPEDSSTPPGVNLPQILPKSAPRFLEHSSSQPSNSSDPRTPGAELLGPNILTAVVSTDDELPDFTPLRLSSTITSYQLPVALSMESCSDSLLKSESMNGPPFTLSEPHAENDIRIPVWAVSRQELCELPYFKSMQGGVYSRAHTVYGYLLGRFPSSRDAWCHDGRLIVSHGGGKNMMNEDQIQPDDMAPLTQFKHQLGDDQLETDASIRGLLRSYRMFRPVVLIAEADYEHLQKFNLKRGIAKEANYYVLGHYAIVAAWAEKEETASQNECPSYTRWKFAFQWIEQSQGPPWWLQTSAVPFPCPDPPRMESYETISPRQTFDRKIELRVLESHEVVLNPYSSPGKEECCQECSTTSPKVYQVQWVCLNPDCESFWNFNDKTNSREELVFDKEFLSLRELPKQIQEVPYSIIPEYPAWESQANQSIFNRYFWAGVCCHKCGRISCRRKWQIWECPTCGERKQESRPQICSVSTLDNPLSWEHYGNSRFNPTDLTATSRIVEYPHDERRMVVYYRLPEDHGQIVHVLNNSSVSHTPNDLFEQYQKDACERDMFQRHAIKTHGVKGELYAQHFSFNAGVPYKYIAEAVSTPFNKCPKSINSAVSHISELCQGALGKHVKFNELLSVAYAEGQEMNFHSDDEPGLDSVVAGLTLGSSAEMIFRPNVSVKKNLVYKNGPYRASESLSVDANNERILHITLSHGDLLIMDGAKIQKKYEHAVFVRDSDLVRFAATARYIKVESDSPTHPHSQQTSSDGAVALTNQTTV